MASIQKKISKINGKPVYYVVFRDPDGRQVWQKAGSRKTDANQLKTKLEHELYSGTYKATSDITAKEFAEKFLEAHKSRIREKTWIGYRQRINYAVSYFGNKRLSSLTPIDVEVYISQLQEEGKSAATIEEYLFCLKSMLKRAVEWGLLLKNPAQFIEPPRKDRKEMDFFTPQEMELLIKNTDERCKCLMTVACYTGLRLGELLGLKWSDIDFNSSRLFVHRTWQRTRFYEPKTKHSKRAVSLPVRVIRAIEAHQLNQMVDGLPNNYDLVFPNLEGQPISDRNMVQRVFEPALKRAGLRRIRFHDLRHSYAAALISAGENPKWIQKQLGHSSITVTFDIYGHLLPEKESTVSVRLEKIFDNQTALLEPTKN